MGERAFLRLAQTAAGRLIIEHVFGGRLDREDFESLSASRQFLKDIRRMSRQGVPSRRTIVHRHGDRLFHEETSFERARREGTDRRQAARVRALDQARSQVGIMAMMGAEPEQAMEGALNPVDRQLALSGHNIQTYADDHDTVVTNVSVARGSWVQLNLAKHQAMLVQRVRIVLPGHEETEVAVGLRWGRPAGAVGTGAPGHASPGVQFDFPEAHDGLGVATSTHQVHAISDVSFEWNDIQRADPSTHSIDFRPNFVLIRSYCVVVGGTGGIGVAPHINLFGKIVNLNFGNILTVK